MTEITVENEINSPETNVNGVDHDFKEDWGFSLDELYKLALIFYKEKEGKAVHLSYKDKIRLVALTKQVTHGKYSADVLPEVGFLDVVGNDRRQAWLTLGDMTKEVAMAEFVKLIDALCPLFKPYIEAHKTEQEEQEKRRVEEDELKRREEEEKERIQLEEEAQRLQLEDHQRRLQQEMQIRAALNQQTAVQFKQYAEQQHPGDTDKQQTLIKQLQEQHFQQYMQQVYQQQLIQQQQQHYLNHNNMASQTPADQENTVTDEKPHTITETTMTVTAEEGSPSLKKHSLDQTNGDAENTPQNNGVDSESSNESDNDLPPVAAASMWTRKDIKEFKESLKKDKDAVIKVGSGETVTVRVPTHEDGTCLFWEFATDNYDIGFGVYFEWTIAPSNAVSVHVSESSDEEDEEEESGGANAEAGKGDVEKGSKKKDNRPPTDEIIPIYRRDCHEEVYCGSHMYPGQGVYLLKFDNSYSLWRSKQLYYRVYYTR
ncbi:Golgi resident protein GCP60-like [Tubulanus polymorphus]|uniref:Golgi resident protein GCP60-like n=1 Tax=Tubulanus polymorphus TaxID=672921 RepID=UPI003DA5A915